ncbi:MAG: hypothetical protein DMF80_21015 [Acidobacteria bacterium]|nr:MAG: hypothetical protein DMF80_21015 [Acidobacteriota bacterium]
MRAPSGRPSLAARTALAAGVAAVYFLAARFGLGFASLAEQVSVVWPPSGMALAALLLLGSRAWPGIWLGAFAANLLAHETWWAAIGIATGNTLEGLAGAWLLRRAQLHESLDRMWDVMALLGLAAALSTTLGATIGVSFLCLSGAQAWSAFGALWSVWWLGDAMGVLLVAPVLLVWASRPRLRWSAGRAAEALGLGACLLASSLMTYGGYFAPLTGGHLAYMVFPLLIWAGVRFGQAAVSPAILLVAAVAVAGTVRGMGPFAGLSASQQLVMLQLFMAVAALTALVLGAAIAERDIAERRRAADYAVVQAMARSATLEEAAPQILQAICDCLEWDMGALWIVDAGGEQLRCVEMWHVPGLEAPEFIAVTRQHRFSRGVGLPGRVWTSGEPAWVSDINLDANFPRAPIATGEGLHSAFSFPISRRGEVAGVVEFFSRAIRRPDEALLQLFAIVGSQIGQFIDRQRAEAAVRASATELRRAGEAKDQFLALLGHELRNPLAPLRHALELLRMKGVEGPVAGRMLEMMERQTALMVRLVDDLLDVSRITRGKIELRREHVVLAAVVERALESARPVLGGHPLSVSLPPEPISLQADPTRLEQVLANLLNNAAKYTPAGGTIHLTAAREGAQAVLRVRDEGIGIRSDMLERVFELFAQADRLPERVQEGLGIGLTLVRSLVEMHGGTVAAASEGPGHGSEFVVRLPCLPAEAEERPPAVPPAAAPTRARTRRVLVVDDNVDSAESLVTLLQMGGHDVRMAHDGPAALALAREHRPELVLLDIGLPAMSGYEVAQLMRPGLERTVIVALTGYGQGEDRRRATEAGFDHHLVKPVDVQKLWQLLRTL